MTDPPTEPIPTPPPADAPRGPTFEQRAEAFGQRAGAAGERFGRDAEAAGQRWANDPKVAGATDTAGRV